MSDEAIDVEACMLLKNPKISQRLDDMREKVAKKTEIDVETITKMLIKAYSSAVGDKQNSAAVAASMGLAKVHGLIENKVRIDGNVNHTSESISVTAGWIDEIIGARTDREAKKSLPH